MRALGAAHLRLQRVEGAGVARDDATAEAAEDDAPRCAERLAHVGRRMHEEGAASRLCAQPV
eukprot:scaffold105366_cov60-Phaeocystis_antarctica.AAC.2